MSFSLTCGGSYYSHVGDLPGYTTRNGISADDRRVVVLETRATALPAAPPSRPGTS
ncbi:hypothetical protein [Streptomyces sp. Ag109_O5-1]|uniref:hypothetical protein n=1 Tax=Streptomyces sp. Ag109_O5-1 TaxID=1938851 RepID=UPI000B10059A|nr:hypothetical protein [Streptomyces sp. Ag109_O5-1]